MERKLILIVWMVISGFVHSALAQETSINNETWYVWIDTEVPIDGKMIKIVSNEPMVITCCPKSAKYRKFVKKAAKWIGQNITDDYDGNLSLMKIQDEEMAKLSISKIKEISGVRIIDYIAVCK
jgi:hypothetical protein